MERKKQQVLLRSGKPDLQVFKKCIQCCVTTAMASSGDEQFDIEEGESETLDAFLDQIAVESSIPGVARSQG